MKNFKYILYFTTFWDTAPNLPMGPTLFEQCPVTNCFITHNQHELPSISQFDAVIFHMVDIELLEQEELPDQMHRNPKQRYVMLIAESPQHWKADFTRFNNFFNWTMTYRQDSDIHYPFGWIVPKESNKSYLPTIDDIGAWDHWDTFDLGKFSLSMKQNPKYIQSSANRTQGIAWIVSHCNSESDRERYVNELRKYIDVDIFGKCGERLCSTKSSSNLTCNEIVEHNYMFYLAFENSFCDHYVTEKLFKWLKMDIVPVVMGQADYASITPPHSVIDAGSYPDPAHLASYLKKLMDNNTEYLSYFWWKEFYEVRSDLLPTYCKLCQMLNDPNQPQKIWHNLSEWWSMRGEHCKPKGSFPWSKYSSLAEGRLMDDVYIFAMLLIITLVLFILLSKSKGLKCGILLLRIAFMIFVVFFLSMIFTASLEIPWNPHLIYTKFHFLWK